MSTGTADPNGLSSLKVLIVDDLPGVRYCFKRVFERLKGLKVVGEAEDGIGAVQMAASRRPDIILMDALMPRMDGAEATKLIMRDFPDTKIIAISGDGDEQCICRMLKAGACAFVKKEDIPQSLVPAIDAVVCQKMFLSPSTLNLVTKGFIERTSETRPEYIEKLSERERQVLHLVSQGSSSKEIADELGLSDKTVDKHKRDIMSKLEISTKSELVRFGIMNC